MHVCVCAHARMGWSKSGEEKNIFLSQEWNPSHLAHTILTILTELPKLLQK